MANTFSSRNTLKTKLLAAINAANTADKIVKLSRSIEKANLDDDADLETALDTKVSSLTAISDPEDLEKLAFGVKKLRTPEGAGVPTSTMVAEGSTNLYVTQDRVRGSFSASGDLSYDSGTGVLSYTALPDALTVYATVGDLPSSGVAAGAKGIVEENKKLYVFTGASWVGVGLVDQKPSFNTNPDGSYSLTPGGDTVITLSATDPQGDLITYSHQVTAGSLGGSSVSQADNVFTITGSSDPADTASFSITFSASDGTNVSTTTPSEFTVQFGIGLGASFGIEYPTAYANANTYNRGWRESSVQGGRTATYGNYIAVMDTSVLDTTATSFVYDVSVSTTTPALVIQRPGYGSGYMSSQNFWVDPNTGVVYLLVFSGNGDGRFWAFNMNTMSSTPEWEMTSPAFQGGYVSGGAFSSDGKYMYVAGTQPRNVYVIDLENKTTKWTIQKGHLIQHLEYTRVHVDNVRQKMIVTDPYNMYHPNGTGNYGISGAFYVYDISDVDNSIPTLDFGVSSRNSGNMFNNNAMMLGRNGAYDESRGYYFSGIGDNVPSSQRAVTVWDITAFPTDGQYHVLEDTGVTPVFTITDPAVDENGNPQTYNDREGFGSNGVRIKGDYVYVNDFSAGTDVMGLMYVFNLSDGSFVETIANPHPEMTKRWARYSFEIGQAPGVTNYIVGVSGYNSGSGYYWQSENNSAAVGYAIG